MIRPTLSILALFLALPSLSQEIIPLYEGAIPNSKPYKDEEKTEYKDGMTIVSRISKPTLSIFLPSKEKSTGTAVVIYPGGGYFINAMGHEGTEVAVKLNEMGVAAFVLKYRIPNDLAMIDRSIGPMQDAQQAILTVKKRAKEWNVNPDRVGIMGFSAGGHLAAVTGTQYKDVKITGADGISLRPAFMILGYPVITFTEPLVHTGVRDQLVGKGAAQDRIKYYSAEMNVTPETPSTFIVHGTDDPVVPVEHSVLFYQALMKNKVKAEMHLYQGGGHGFGLNNKTTEDQWIERCRAWMISNGWVSR